MSLRSWLLIPSDPVSVEDIRNSTVTILTYVKIVSKEQILLKLPFANFSF